MIFLRNFADVMKKSLLTILFAAASVVAVASPPFRLGIRAGFNSSNFSETRSAITLNQPQWKKGFIAGVEMDMPLLVGVHLAPGFFFDHRNNDYTAVDGNVHTNGSVSSSWFQFQLMASYHISALSFATLQLDFGPYVAYGIGGSNKYQTMTYYDLMPPMASAEFSSPTFGHEGAYFRTDWGFKIGAGFLVARHYYVGAHYLAGARNMSLRKSTVDSSKTRAWEFTLGYNF